MAKTDFKSVDEYIAAQPEAAQGILERVRSTIRKAVPGAEEVISYQIPTYKLQGCPVLYFALPVGSYHYGIRKDDRKWCHQDEEVFVEAGRDTDVSCLYPLLR